MLEPFDLSLKGSILCFTHFRTPKPLRTFAGNALGPQGADCLREEGNRQVAIWLDRSAEDFEARFTAFLTTKREVSEDVNAVVRDIIADVRARGDAALADYSQRFDGIDFSVLPMKVTDAEIDAAVAEVDPVVLEALHLAAERIEKHHARQLPKDDIYEDAIGVTLGSRWTAIEAVGLYVPGGTASYPSSVLMNALPARVAGVERIVMVVPAQAGQLNPTVLAAARIAGVKEIYRIGGAQAVAALAYGTGSIAPVAKIVGPGNAYVAAAKRQVFGTVGIDMIAGPLRSAGDLPTPTTIPTGLQPIFWPRPSTTWVPSRS